MTESQTKKRSFRGLILFGSGFISGIVVVGLILAAIYFYFTQKISSMDASLPTAGKFYDIGVARSLDRAEAELRNAKDEYHRWLALGELAVFYIDIGKLNEAEKYANELLELAPKYQKDWNYGNAIHKGHIALGRLQLRKNNLSGAKEHLIEAGNTPGSPQLDSFGPNMILAKELLEKGERDSVIKYLDLCEAFWEMHSDRLKKWKDTIKTGGIPNFEANLLY